MKKRGYIKGKEDKMYYEKKQINILGIKLKFKVKVKDDFIKNFR